MCESERAPANALDPVFFSSEKRRRMDRNEEWQSRPSYSLPYTQRTRNRQTWWVILVHTHTHSRAPMYEDVDVCVCVYIYVSRQRPDFVYLACGFCSARLSSSIATDFAWHLKKNIYSPPFLFFSFFRWANLNWVDTSNRLTQNKNSESSNGICVSFERRHSSTGPFHSKNEVVSG